MTRSADTKALLQALRHIINEEADQATALLRQVMLSKARQAHESMLRGGSPLTEGWDDEIAVEEYFSEADLDDTEDTVAGVPDSDPLADGDAVSTVDAAADEISGDLADVDDVATDMPTDLEADEVDGAGDEDITAAEVKAELDKFAAEFEQFMAELDADGDGDHDMEDHEMASSDDEKPEEDDMSDIGDVGDEVPADDVPAGDEADASGDEMADAEDEKINEEDDFADITESVMAELEKVTASLVDGKEVGSHGKTVGASKTSPIPDKASAPTGTPLKIDSDTHASFEREPAPAVKTIPARKFQRPKTSTVAAPPNKEGTTGKGSSVKVGTTSPLPK
jgi:hypothetical protein